MSASLTATRIIVPQVPGVPGPLVITVKARATLNATIRLSVLASDDLRSGVRTIPASNITWTATGVGFVPGTLNRTTPQTVGSWIGSGVRTGSQSLFFGNVWTHPTGTYTLDHDVHAELAVTLTGHGASSRWLSRPPYSPPWR